MAKPIPVVPPLMTAILPARVDIAAFFVGLFVNGGQTIIAVAGNDNQRISDKIYALKEWIKRRDCGQWIDFTN
jgi:hypothetical protein